jgi:hypothetical protein
MDTKDFWTLNWYQFAGLTASIVSIIIAYKNFRKKPATNQDKSNLIEATGQNKIYQGLNHTNIVDNSIHYHEVPKDIITVTELICVDLGGRKKALGKRTYNRKYDDTTALAGSELFFITETGDDVILPTGEFKKLTQPYIPIPSEDPCDCISHTF